jgi:hypothetical protein
VVTNVLLSEVPGVPLDVAPGLSTAPEYESDDEDDEALQAAEENISLSDQEIADEMNRSEFAGFEYTPKSLSELQGKFSLKYESWAAC